MRKPHHHLDHKIPLLMLSLPFRTSKSMLLLLLLRVSFWSLSTNVLFRRGPQCSFFLAEKVSIAIDFCSLQDLE